ncbi:hypothetical protein Dimus_017060 [Dionaea muscipula]
MAVAIHHLPPSSRQHSQPPLPTTPAAALSATPTEHHPYRCSSPVVDQATDERIEPPTKLPLPSPATRRRTPSHHHDQHLCPLLRCHRGSRPPPPPRRLPSLAIAEQSSSLGRAPSPTTTITGHCSISDEVCSWASSSTAGCIGATMVSALGRRWHRRRGNNGVGVGDGG